MNSVTILAASSRDVQCVTAWYTVYNTVEYLRPSSVLRSVNLNHLSCVKEWASGVFIIYIVLYQQRNGWCAHLNRNGIVSRFPFI